jgi:hypothetical protein
MPGAARALAGEKISGNLSAKPVVDETQLIPSISIISNIQRQMRDRAHRM